MTGRFVEATHPAVFAAMGLAIAATFAGDMVSVLGVSVWIFYLVPVALSLLVRRPGLPIAIAAGCTVLMAISYPLKRDGVLAWIALLNRCFGLVTLWAAAIGVRQLILSNLALRHQAWVRDAEALLSERLRGEQSPVQLAERVARFLAEYLGARIGALYAADGATLRRLAGYALPDSSVGATLRLGEGLVGEAARADAVMRVDDVPEGYLPVSSGIGARSPAALLLVPLRADDELAGVLELGFFKAPYQADARLLERLAEPIAIALRTASLRAQRESLLVQTQRQASELQSQQEELRVTNEELEEQSDALRASQARLETQQAELEQLNVELEERAEMLERHNAALRTARSELSEKALDLERSSRYKSEFLANMSHELRTPLNSTLILAKLLADNPRGNLDDEQIRFAQTIYASGNDLLELINDILDLSKIESGKVDVIVEPVEVRMLVESVLQTIRPLATNKGLSCTVSYEPQAPLRIHSDAQRLRQILKNLLSNAVKFTESGGVGLEVLAGPDGGVGLAVRDTGIGIAIAQREAIFEPFHQADGTTNRKYGGTGLGLSISRELAQRLGGRIELDSEVGQGSTFTLWLPPTAPGGETLVASEPARARAPAPLPALQREPVARTPVAVPADDRDALPAGARVLLVVEDDEIFAKTVCDTARAAGYRCLIATTADDGIALALRHRPTAIVLDVGLPDHTGLAVLDRLKHNSATRHIPVQVVSAEDHSQPALEMGAAGVMLKPVRYEELLGVLSTLERKASPGERMILVVEDNDVQRDSICRLLESQQVRTVAVDTAGAALERLQSDTFDCMVLDLSLPDASGYQLLETMAHQELYAFPPVIVYTGRALSPDDEQQLRRYSRSIIVKGARSPERLLDEVTLFLHQVESQLPPDHQQMLRDARSRDAVFEGRRILVVEDDVRNIFALSRVLEPNGVEVVIARNGREAVERVERQEPIDLILMDIMMPEMDGLEATRRIRALPGAARLPIIALTAKAMPDDHQRCLDAGADDYLTKPIDVDKLLSLIRVWLPREASIGRSG